MLALGSSARTSALVGSNVRLRVAPFGGVKPVAAPRQTLTVTAGGRRCELTGTKRNKANSVSFSNRHTRKFQYPNLQEKKLFWAHGQRWVKIKICTRALKSISKKGLDAMATEAGINLWDLPYEDARPARLAYLAANPRKVPVAKNPRAMKNPVKLAASKKNPRYPVYEQGGRIIWIKPGMEEAVLGEASDAQAAGEARAVARAARADGAAQELKVTLTSDEAPAAAEPAAPSQPFTF